MSYCNVSFSQIYWQANEAWFQGSCILPALIWIKSQISGYLYWKKAAKGVEAIKWLEWELQAIDNAVPTSPQ